MTCVSSVFLPAADIPSFVGKGDVDIGITGHDVILEAGMSDLVTEVLQLGFGQCALQVSVYVRIPHVVINSAAGTSTSVVIHYERRRASW